MVRAGSFDLRVVVTRCQRVLARGIGVILSGWLKGDEATPGRARSLKPVVAERKYATMSEGA